MKYKNLALKLENFCLYFTLSNAPYDKPIAIVLTPFVLMGIFIALDTSKQKLF